MKQGKYIGSNPILKDKTALLMEYYQDDTLVQAQFDDLTLSQLWTHGWNVFPIIEFRELWPRERINDQHPIIGKNYRLVKDNEIIEPKDQTALISELLSLDGGKWVYVRIEDHGKTVEEYLKPEIPDCMKERLIRRPIKKENKPDYKESVLLICPYCESPVISPCIWFDKDDYKIIKITNCAICQCKLLITNDQREPHPSITIESNPGVRLDILIHIDPIHRIGCTGVTDIWIKTISLEQYEARMGISIFGTTNFESSIGACPFDQNYHDNYVKGVGITKDEAIENLKKDYESIQNSLF